MKAPSRALDETTALQREVDTMIGRARAAQQALEGWSEVRVDCLLRAFAHVVAASAGSLAAETVSETGWGIAEHKAVKIHAASVALFATMEGHRAHGLLDDETAPGVMQVASPMGVVFGLVPITNPVPTVVFKTLISLKGRNALIYSCHRRTSVVGGRVGELIRSVLVAHGAPPYLVQWVEKRTGRAVTKKLMAGADFVLATGGPSMVRAAHSSGTPAIGVGPGNAPVWVREDADLWHAARSVIESKRFDNGIICASESNLVVDAAVRFAFVEALRRQGAAVLTTPRAALYDYHYSPLAKIRCGKIRCGKK